MKTTFKIKSAFMAICLMTISHFSFGEGKIEVKEVQMGANGKQNVVEPLLKETKCSKDIDYRKNDPDVVKQGDRSTVNVMFHESRYVAANELVKEFERQNPKEVVSYTSLPAINSMLAVLTSGKDAGEAGSFSPDVVMGPSMWSDMKAAKDTSKSLTDHGKYSDVHGMVLIYRKDNKKIGTDWVKAVKDERVKLSIPSEKTINSPLIGAYELAFGKDGLSTLKSTGKAGGTNARYYRSMPERIKGGCEDAGVIYYQSVPYLEIKDKDVFKYIAIPISDGQKKSEESFVFTVNAGKHQESAVRFSEFMHSESAQGILKRYNLEQDGPSKEKSIFDVLK